jgi:hypothetical protein
VTTQSPPRTFPREVTTNFRETNLGGVETSGKRHVAGIAEHLSARVTRVRTRVRDGC